TDYADLVIGAIEEIIDETDVRVFIIDSVTRIAALSYGRNSSAAYIMKSLVNLQLRSGCSLLVISHDSTKSADRALINLAATEITAKKPEAPITTGAEPKISECSKTLTNLLSEYSEYSECSECSKTPAILPSENSECSEYSECSIPSYPSASKLSRRERRLLRRQAQKESNFTNKKTR
ncbi:MAG: AAA family ATPase, partial [Muribaculaceae bacterium]|nr:AAA family ATPase [Muribaculaceae bacterium]